MANPASCKTGKSPWGHAVHRRHNWILNLIDRISQDNLVLATEQDNASAMRKFFSLIAVTSTSLPSITPSPSIAEPTVWFSESHCWHWMDNSDGFHIRKRTWGSLCTIASGCMGQCTERRMTETWCLRSLVLKIQGGILQECMYLLGKWKYNRFCY